MKKRLCALRSYIGRSSPPRKLTENRTLAVANYFDFIRERRCLKHRKTVAKIARNETCESPSLQQ
jgi:hypothetical protein